MNPLGVTVRGNNDANVWAVVVTYNRPETLALVLDALVHQSRPLAGIYVVDNGADINGQIEQITAPYAEKVFLMRNPMNLGGAGGFAMGMKEALKKHPDWLWLLDDDAVPAKDALALLLSFEEKQASSTGALLPSVWEDGELALQHRRFFSSPIGWERPVPLRCYQETKIMVDIGSFVGCLLAASAVRNIGMPNTAFFLAYDDTEYFLRLKNEEWCCWLIPASRIDHMRPRGARMRQQSFNARHYYNIRNRIVVKRNFASCGLVSQVASCIFGLLIWLAAPGNRITALPLFWKAVTDGWRQRLGPLRL